MQQATITPHDNYSTKRLARQLGVTRAALLAGLRDNRVPLRWHAGTSTWQVVYGADVATAVDHYTNA